MGKIDKIIYEKLINSEPVHNKNLLRVYRAPNGEVTIHLRNLKIVLHAHEIEEWVKGFKISLDKLKQNG